MAHNALRASCSTLLTKMAAAQTPMYKLPVLYHQKSPVELSNSMYSMKTYHNGDDKQIVCNGEQGADISSLEKRQESLLNDLVSLQNEVKSFASNLGVRLPTKSAPMTVDHVISASPEDPPRSVFILQHILNQRGVVHSTSVFAHSSVAGINLSKLPSFELSRNDKDRNSPCLITIIWKKASDLPALVISANHTPLVGECTIARHLCRTLLPDLYSRLSLEEIAEVDHWMSLASESIINGKNKERANALQSLNIHLGKSSWLVNNKMTLADVAVASAILKTDFNKAPANVKKWLQNFAPQ